MPRNARPSWQLLLAVALLPTLASCSSGAAAGSATTSTGAHIALVAEGTLTVCTNLPYAPFEFAQGDDYVGFDIDLLHLVSKDLGVTQEVVDVPFETIKTGAALNASQCDIAASGLSITPERKNNLSFSSPYYDAGQALVVRKGTAVASLADAKGMKLGSQSATTGEDYVTSKGFDPVSFESADAELNGLRTGQVDVLVQDLPVVTQWLKDPGGNAFVLAATLHTGEQYGFATKKTGSSALLARVDAVLSAAKTDGTYDTLYRKWFGRAPVTGGAG